MARAAVSDRIVTVFGGGGFIGRHVVRRLAEDGWRIRVAVRRPELTGYLQPLGAVGQIHAVQANLRHEGSVAAALAGAAAAVNLVGVLAPSGRQSFRALHARGPRLIASHAAAAGIPRFCHVSALGADPDSPSLYARTKAEGEAGALAALPETVVLRPSVVFGPEDSFLNRFAGMARIMPALPLIGGGETRFQPVFVDNVAEAVARALSGGARSGTIYELGGPEIMTFREILDYVLAVTGRRRLLLSLPFPLARLVARVAEILPGAPLTIDQVRLLARDNVVSEAAIRDGRTLADLGIEPTALDAVAPAYLGRYRRAGQFSPGTAG